MSQTPIYDELLEEYKLRQRTYKNPLMTDKGCPAEGPKNGAKDVAVKPLSEAVGGRTQE